MLQDDGQHASTNKSNWQTLDQRQSNQLQMNENTSRHDMMVEEETKEEPPVFNAIMTPPLPLERRSACRSNNGDSNS